jgi:hypothetical protein
MFFYIEDPAAVLDEVFRVLRPGGRLVIHTAPGPLPPPSLKTLWVLLPMVTVMHVHTDPEMADLYKNAGSLTSRLAPWVLSSAQPRFPAKAGVVTLCGGASASDRESARLTAWLARRARHSRSANACLADLPVCSRPSSLPGARSSRARQSTGCPTGRWQRAHSWRRQPRGAPDRESCPDRCQ